MPVPELPEDLVPDLERLAVGAVAATARAIAEVAPDLSFLQWRVLAVVAESPHGVPVSIVAARIGSKLPAASRLVARLRQRGFLTVEKSATDARVSTVSLTPAGELVRGLVAARRRDALRTVLEGTGLRAADTTAVRRLAAAFARLT